MDSNQGSDLMGFIEDIDKGLRKIGDKIEKEDPAYIRADCPECGEKDIMIYKMRARHGKTRCPKCRAYFVVMMGRD